MPRNFKMFDHIVDPETRSKSWSFMNSRPLETFLIISVLYMFTGLFSYRSLFQCYLALICFSFIQQYKDYLKDKCFDVVYKNIMQIMINERNKIVMSPFMRTPDIDDGNASEEEEHVSEERVSEEHVSEDEHENALVDVQKHMDILVRQATMGNLFEDEKDSSDITENTENTENTSVSDNMSEGASKVEEDVDTEVSSYLELRKRQVPRGKVN